MQRSQHQPLTVDISIYAGVYVKTFVVPDRGTLVPQHSHRWPHISSRVRCDARVVRRRAAG
jgi:hypothetical protein